VQETRGWWAGHELVVLAWHNIDPTWRWPAAPGLGRTRFGRQLRALRRFTNVVPLDTALRALRDGGRLPPRATALTFDDGYRDNLTVATPMLRELGLPATVFLLPDLLDGRADPWWERLAWATARTSVPELIFESSVFPLGDPARGGTSVQRLEEMLKTRDAADRQAAVARIVDALDPVGEYRPEELFMDWDEAARMVKAGIGIGSHTCDHAILARESAQAQRADVRRARVKLKDELETPVDTLAYPNGQIGDYDSVTIRAVADAGYSFGLTAWGLVNDAGTDPYEIRRRMVSPVESAARVTLGVVRGVRRAHREAADRPAGTVLSAE
jgi:peptidoglycan/xylan/chitin deacetylase (PgdA/CDA1 family)